MLIMNDKSTSNTYDPYMYYKSTKYKLILFFLHLKNWSSGEKLLKSLHTD